MTVQLAVGQLTRRFERFSTLDGLGNNAVFDIATDSKGYIWFATYDGLSSYDGYQFKNYKPGYKNQELAGYNIMNVIAPDKNGKIWFGTVGLGLSVLNPSTNIFTTYKLKDTNLVGTFDKKSTHYMPYAN